MCVRPLLSQAGLRMRLVTTLLLLPLFLLLLIFFSLLCFLYSGADDSELRPSHKHSPSSLVLPDPGNFVLMIITSVFTPQRFFAQMPIGPNALTIEASQHGE